MRLLVALFALFVHFNANASRGWYMSVAGISSKQDHKISDYKSTATVNDIQQSYSTSGTTITNQTYDFSQTSTTQAGYVSYATLNNAVSGKYINGTETFYLATNDPSRTVTTPVVGGTAMGTNTTATSTHTGTGQTIATVTYTGSNGIYKVDLSPISWTTQLNAIETQVQTELNSTTLANTTQLQNFLKSFQDKSSTGVELSIGYKFRPFQSSWFLAPQVDFTNFGNKTKQTAYANSTNTSFSQTADSTHTTAITRDTLDSSMAFSMVGKIGYENSILLGLTKIPFSIYGVLGGASAMRKYRDVRTNNLGAKYGIGGEVFLSKKLALFAEFYQIQFFEQNVDYKANNQKYTNSDTVNATLNSTANAGTTVTISNGGTGGTAKSTTYQYSSLAQSMGEITYNVNEVFKIQSKTSAFKVGLTYYF